MLQIQLFLVTGKLDRLCPLALRSLDPGPFLLLNFFGRERSYDLLGRVTRIVIESRDPCTNSHGFTQAELLENSVKVIVCFDTEREKSSLNLLLCIAVICRLCHNISRLLRWVRQPRRTVPP